MASKLIKLTDSNGNLLIPAVVSQAVQVKNGATAVDLQTAYEGIRSQISDIALAELEGLAQSLTYASYISQPANNKISYYLINGDGDVKTNVFTINDVSHASSADDATNASKLTTGKLTYNGSTGTLTYNFGDGDKNVSILGTTSAYGFVKFGTGPGHAAKGNHTHTTSVDQSTAIITAGGTSTSAIKGNTSSYGFVKFDTNPTNNSTNAVTSSYIYNSYTYIKNQLNNKAAANHTHNYGVEIIADNTVPDGFTPTGDTVTAVSYFSTNTINSLVDGSIQSFEYAPVNLPTKKYIDDNFVTQSEFETFSASGMHYMGETGNTPTFSPANVKQGDVYTVSVAGHGISGSEPGDFIVYNGRSWDIWDKNVTGAMYHGTTSLTSNQIVMTDGAAGKVKSVAAPSIEILANVTSGPTTMPAVIKYLFNGNRKDLPIYGYNGVITTVGSVSGFASYIGISYTPDHVGSGTAGKLLYWETATKHSAITSTYGYDNANNIGLMFVDGGALKNISKISGSPSIPTYVAEGYIRPVSSIDSSLYYNDSYIILNGSNQVSTVDGANVAATTNLLYLHASSSNYKDTPIKIVGTKGIRVSSQDSGRTLNIEQNFAQADVVTGFELTHSTYYYEATNVTVDDFTLYNFSTSKKYLEGASVHSTLAYVRQNS